MKHKIVVTQPIHEAVLARLQSAGKVVMNPGPEPWSEEVLYQHLKDADAMMAFMPDRVDQRTLLNAPRLKTIACALKGYDNFDLKACAQAGVSVSFVPDLLTEPTAELAIGLAIAAARHVLAGDANVRRGYAGWRPQLYGTGLHGSVVSVVGLGAVGRAIVDRLIGFGCAQLLGVDPHGEDERLTMVSLGEALSKSDYVILAVPLLDMTRHLINEAMLEGVRPGQVLVNIGRGSVVDEAAVAQALQDGRLGAYAADVYEMEDWLLADRPREIHPELLEHPATVLTPHIGSAVKKVRQAIEMRAAENLLQALEGCDPQDLCQTMHDAVRLPASHCPVQP
ncbi:phosphonate dehydrogenase [Hydrogenophaga palleronii]|uniref:Phosphonate dehydrogenase n=1 Tax=Hydrogenophaga palleronii TaxID=65655 RepID=A0ABU1WQG6_9BURK|nr:phosphonate dehydrogenase [Hydrogenophaga palleronii]MDR7151142.1 phosphonate dehydrogenase [Hydrogenophaga palleronii]